jgi:cell wall-associated NlpC family hydrolase
MPSGGVSGLAVTLTAAGGVLVVAAIRNQSPIDVVKAVIGRPTAGKALGTALGTVTSGVGVATGSSITGTGASVGAAAATAASGGGPLLAEVRKHLGAKYVFGAVGPNTFDCSGLIIYSLRKTLIPNCPRWTTFTASSFFKKQGWQRVTPEQFRAGDVIIRTGHMGIAVSNTRLIHAPHTGTVVKEANIADKSNWWGYRP